MTVSRFARVWFLCALLAGAPVLAAAPAWKPDRAVEIVAVNAPGGGSDRIIRIMATVMQEKRLVATPIAVVNKPGGGGAVAYAYLNQRPGDGHHVVLGSKAVLTNNIVGQGPSYAELTPVANLFAEYVSVTVRADSPIRTGRDLVERMKKDPAALSFGIANSLGNFNHIGVAAVLKSAGVEIRKMRSVVFQSGGAATTAMLGGHIDVVPITAAYAATLQQNGQVRVIAVTSPQRLSGALAEVPTWREQGHDVVVTNSRLVYGPKGMSDGQIAWWDAAMKRLGESDEWKKELEANFWVPEYLPGAEARKYLERENVALRALLGELGLAR